MGKMRTTGNQLTTTAATSKTIRPPKEYIEARKWSLAVTKGGNRSGALCSYIFLKNDLSQAVVRFSIHLPTRPHSTSFKKQQYVTYRQLIAFSRYLLPFPNRKPSKVVDKYRTSFPSGPLLIDASPQSKVFQGVGWFVILLSRYQTFSTAKTLSQSKYYTVLTLLWSWVKCFFSRFQLIRQSSGEKKHLFSLGPPTFYISESNEAFYWNNLSAFYIAKFFSSLQVQEVLLGHHFFQLSSGT